MMPLNQDYAREIKMYKKYYELHVVTFSDLCSATLDRNVGRY